MKIPSAGHIVSEVWSYIVYAWNWVQSTTGLNVWEIVTIAIAVFLFKTFFGGSGKGRGRRYRRGYKVAYLEERGKLAARRAEKHRDEKDSHVVH